MLRTFAQPTTPAVRRTIRYAAAAIAAGCAAVYVAIGLGMIYPPNAERTGLFVFGVSAGLAFALGAVLLATTDRRSVLAFGALFQVFAIVMYVAVAQRRDPPFEIWGLSLKVAQAALLVALLLLLRPVDRRAGGGESGRSALPLA